ncbi:MULTISPECIES: hypothetical protein [Bacillaceae]|uniref:hypothetical protein n=1 Tax=Bacillaceae TaxID=186817 RepID=UPI0011888ACF|nr:hypothetical protein [Bacillus sp. S3]QCJ42463.1 hypothetical protein FAY30_11365 [Bacillus sp. S3]
MTELNFHQIAHELLKKEVEIVTLQGTFTGRLLEVGRDVLVLESRGRMRQRLLAVRIDVIVAIFRVEQMPRGPFGFTPEEFDQEHDQHESSDH